MIVIMVKVIYKLEIWSYPNYRLVNPPMLVAR